MGAQVRERLFASLTELTLATAPALLIGVAAAASIAAVGGRISSIGGAVRGALAGAPNPVCACGVLPLAQSLRARGARAEWIVAFLIAAPGLGVTTLAVSAQLMGWPFAVIRI